MDSLQERLDQLRAKLARQQRVLDHLDFDIERPLQFAQTDSPDYAITLVGKGLERLLKQMWLYFQVEGDPASRTIAQLMRPLREHVQGGPVLEAFEEIQRGRNRAAHDGYEVTYADALAVIERFSVVLEWFSIECADLWNTGAIEMNPQVQARIEFVEGLQSAMGFTLASRFDLSPETSYLVFQQQTGRRVTYLEVILSVSLRELRHVWAETAGTLMATSYPKSTLGSSSSMTSRTTRASPSRTRSCAIRPSWTHLSTPRAWRSTPPCASEERRLWGQRRTR